MNNIRKNVKTSFMPQVRIPKIGDNCKIEGVIIGAVVIGEGVNIGQSSVVRGDEGFDLYVGDKTSLGQGVILHGLETEDHGEKVEKNLVLIENKEYSVYVGKGCSLGDGVQVHGPAAVLDEVIMMPDSFVFKGTVMKGCIIGQGAKVIGVTIPEGKYVPAGITIKTKEQMDALLSINEAANETFTRINYLDDIDIKKAANIEKGESTYIDSEAIIVGDIKLGNKVYAAPYSYVISNNKTVTVGSDTNIQDGAILLDSNIGNRISLAHQSKVFRSIVEDDTFIGMQSAVFDCQLGKGCVIEPGSVVKGVKIAPERYVSSGTVLDKQEDADQLPIISDDYVFKKLNKGVVHVNEQLAEEYSKDNE